MPLPTTPGRWIADPRGDGRGVRISAHPEGGFLVISTWKESACVGTVHLLPDEAAALVAGISDGLARLAQQSPDAITQARLGSFEQRLAALEQQSG